MSLTPSYACFGCVPFAHNQRLKTYVDWACRTGRLPGRKPPTAWLCTCDDDDEAFVDPITDQVCWYDPLIPESAEFLGVAIFASEGIRASTFSREVQNALSRGSVFSMPIIVGKQIQLEMYLYATSAAGMAYGQEWLRRLFENDMTCPSSATTCSSCQGEALTVRVHCSDGSLDPGLRTWLSAATIDGFDLVEDNYPMGRTECNTMRAGSVTLGTESPDSYTADPVATTTIDISGAFTALGNCLTIADLPTLDDVCCPICSTGCDPCTTDPACDCLPPFVLEPEVIGGAAPCFGDPVCRCISAMQIIDLPAGYQTALRMTIQAGFDESNTSFSRNGMRNAVIRVFENPDAFPVPADVEDYDALTARMLPCAEVGISWMPPGSELVIDGLSGKSWLKCNGRCVDHSARVFTISGSIFPLKARCTDLIITAEWDCLNSQSDDSSGKILTALTVESFLGFRS